MTINFYWKFNKLYKMILGKIELRIDGIIVAEKEPKILC